MSTRDLAELQDLLSHSFTNPALLEQAVTHASATTGACTDNERLEFLGDAVVSLAVNDYLYRLFTTCEEGILTEIKSAVVSAPALARRARTLQLHEFARMGRGMPSGDDLSDSVLANLFEAVIGALYLDAGFGPARDMVVAQLSGEIESAAQSGGNRNYKAALQKLSSTRYGELPRYNLVSESGPDHEKVFEVAASIRDRSFPAARGRSKKDAEQRAAAMALDVLNAEQPEGEQDAG